MKRTRRRKQKSALQPQRSQAPSDSSAATADRQREEKLVIERMVDEGCPNVQPIAPGESTGKDAINGAAG
ncbi:MAG: hypothetical protein CHACPFDD_02268 [Phycisphaerae bacterium]|nr:hypothetical protein [Phycisphaerae bacterium]